MLRCCLRAVLEQPAQAGEACSAFGGKEATGDLHVQLVHAQILLRKVVGEGHAPVGHGTQAVVPVLSQSQGQIAAAQLSVARSCSPTS